MSITDPIDSMTNGNGARKATDQAKTTMRDVADKTKHVADDLIDSSKQRINAALDATGICRSRPGISDASSA